MALHFYTSLKEIYSKSTTNSDTFFFKSITIDGTFYCISIKDT